VNFDDLVRSVVRNDLGASLKAFWPEVALCGTIVAVLLLKTISPGRKSLAFYLTMLGLFVALILATPWGWFSESSGWLAALRSWLGLSEPTGIPPAASLFTGVLVADSFTVVLRCLLLLFSMLFVTLTQMAGPPDRDGTTEFYVLMLGALVGMCLMIAANHVLIVVLGMEMASVPCYVLAGMQRNRPKSSEAALKYAVFGAGAAGVMLYGLSLLVGALGSAHLPTMTARLADLLQDPAGLGPQQTTVLILGGLMLTVGVAFKLSAVPLHFWAPDVFEGATAEVAAFLSVASKAAALGLLVRLAGGFAFPSGLGFPEDPSLRGDAAAAAAAAAALASVRQYIVAVLSLLAAVTCTFGNLAAYGQTNMKRLLAYSTIAHAGYMMMPVAAAVALVGDSPDGAREAVASLIVYLGVYLFMNLAAFAIVAFLRNAIGSEDIADYAGLMRASPGLTVCMAIVMFALVGLPPLAGFWGKFYAFYALVQAKLLPLLLVGVLNTVLSLFYYLRVVKVMVFAPEPLHRPAPVIPLTSMVGSYCLLLTLPVVVLFFVVGGLLARANEAASNLFR
jgi:NADH-quinone oxidoreductase subunit N